MGRKRRTSRPAAEGDEEPLCVICGERPFEVECAECGNLVCSECDFGGVCASCDDADADDEDEYYYDEDDEIFTS